MHFTFFYRDHVLANVHKDFVEELVIPGDGYCLVNSVIVAMERLKLPGVPTRDILLQMAKYDILSNMDIYNSFIDNEDDFKSKLEKYISHGSYNSDIVDLVMYSLSNSLKLTINTYVLEGQFYVLEDLRRITPHSGISNRRLNIVRHRDHFHVILINGKPTLQHVFSYFLITIKL